MPLQANALPLIRLNKSKLHYRVFGNGPRVLLAFHGYGQSSAYYLPMEKALGQEYTIYAFDLFFHGESRLYKEQLPLAKDHLQDLVALLLEEKGIQKFTLMGFSMGGKFALTLVEQMPDKIEELYLIAPDGIKTSFWYNIATYPGWMQQVFKRTVIKPGLFFKVVQVLHRSRVMPKTLLRFAYRQMNSPSKRLQVYRTWVGFRKLNFDIRQVVETLNRQQVPVTMILGEFDQIITASRMKAFVKALDKGELVLLKSGHSHLLHEVAELLHQRRLI